MLAIKLYETMPEDNENVIKGISPKIPAMVVDLSAFPDYPIDETFIQMSNDDFNTYTQSIQTELNNWKQIQEDVN